MTTLKIKNLEIWKKLQKEQDFQKWIFGVAKYFYISVCFVKFSARKFPKNVRMITFRTWTENASRGSFFRAGNRAPHRISSSGGSNWSWWVLPFLGGQCWQLNLPRPNFWMPQSQPDLCFDDELLWSRVPQGGRIQVNQIFFFYELELIHSQPLQKWINLSLEKENMIN